MGALVTIGVPVYRGEAFLEETLKSIQAQTYREFEAIMSLDGPDPACEEICGRFTGDSRFRLVVQPRRLGWVGNLNWLLSQITGEFWYYHQQDDLADERYVETLLTYAYRTPAAALVYCDVVPFGRIEGYFEQPSSVLGTTALVRQMALLHEQFPAFAFRGLTRTEAVRQAGGVPTNDVDNFGCDIAWLAGIALSGELHRVPLSLYRKRYHWSNTESTWWAWTKEMRLRAWSAHCVDMLEQALRAGGTAQELRLLWFAAIERLTSPRAASHVLCLDELTTDDRRTMFESFMQRARASTVHEIPSLLDAKWDEIREWSKGFYWIPSTAPVEIIAFGPNPIVSGQPFNVQPDGRSAVWVLTSGPAAPGSRIRLGEMALDTVLRGTLLTASVPAAATEKAGSVQLSLVAPGGSPRSQSVMLHILDGGGG